MDPATPSQDGMDLVVSSNADTDSWWQKRVRVARSRSRPN